MPGILPMKVIKVGTSAQSRIAQACDRCRSKKIRCDGITPCCTQCSNVGFECKTSDKLSRRAFPRGYTESLEERVRALEAEVKELKDLLDEKDEKIDILSRISSGSRRTSNSTSSPPPRSESKTTTPSTECHEPKDEDTFRVQQSPCLLDAEHADSYFMGASSGRAFVDTFKIKVQESGKPCTDFKTETFFATERKVGDSPGSSFKRPAATKVPPRLVSDQMINIFFQEWAPLFPVLHRPTFLATYSDYVTNPESMMDQHSIVQLNLVFGISALSTDWNKQSAVVFENQWRNSIEPIQSENSLATLQCLVLAQIYCIARADYDRLLHYKGMAISLSHRLGLHQSQKRFSLGALTVETRKKVFWTLYTLDCFSAALLGLPKLLNDSDIHAEYPADIDDENVSERGFQSTLPGEATRLCSALALFRASRIMSKVLDENYPAASSHDLSLQRIGALSDELDTWQNSLSSHLRLQFVQDKPSTNIVGSRAPLLSLAYHYIRTLIHRPAVGSSLGQRASSSVVALASSSKNIIQIVQLLEERRMSFSLCLNKNELLLLAGFGLLYQGLDLDREGKLIQDSQRLMCSVIEILERHAASGAADFKKVACAMISVDRFSKSVRALDQGAVSRRKSDGNMLAPKTTSKSARKQLQAIASRFGSKAPPTAIKTENIFGARRTTVSDDMSCHPTLYTRSDSQNSATSVVSDPTHQHGYCRIPGNVTQSRPNTVCETPNLDYLSFNDEPTQSPTVYAEISKTPEHDLLTCFSPTQQTEAPYNSLYPSPDVLSTYISPSPASANFDWASDLLTVPPDLNSHSVAACSVLSVSEEELTSGEEFSNCEPGIDFGGIAMPEADSFGGLDGLDNNNFSL